MYNKNNIFTRIIRRQLSITKVYEGNSILAFLDIHPVGLTHIFIPLKGKYIDFTDFIKKASGDDIQNYFNKIIDIIRELGLKENGYRLKPNKGRLPEQSVSHFYPHIIGGRKLTELIG